MVTKFGRPDPAVSFTPTTNFSGTGSFRYTISDGRGGTAFATVTVTVNAPAGVPNGTVLYTNSTPGAFSYTIPAGVPFVDIEIWGAGARGIALFGNPVGGRGGGYVKKHIAVTTGQAIAGTIANYVSVGMGATTVTSPALHTGDGQGGATTNPSGGDINTSPPGCCAGSGTGHTWTGGASPNGGGIQDTQNANGNAPGGGGAGTTGLGAPGRVVIKARTS